MILFDLHNHVALYINIFIQAPIVSAVLKLLKLTLKQTKGLTQDDSVIRDNKIYVLINLINCHSIGVVKRETATTPKISIFDLGLEGVSLSVVATRIMWSMPNR